MGQTLSNPPPNVRLPPWGSWVQIVSCHLKWPNNQSGSFCSVVPDRLSGDCQFLGSSHHPRCTQCQGRRHHFFRPRFARDCCHRRCQRWRASKESCWLVCWCLPPSTSHISDLSSCHNRIPHRSRNWHLQSNNCVSDAIGGGGRWAANRVTLWQDLCQDPVIVLGIDGQKLHAVLLAKVLGFIEAWFS